MYRFFIVSITRSKDRGLTGSIIAGAGLLAGAGRAAASGSAAAGARPTLAGSCNEEGDVLEARTSRKGSNKYSDLLRVVCCEC